MRNASCPSRGKMCSILEGDGLSSFEGSQTAALCGQEHYHGIAMKSAQGWSVQATAVFSLQSFNTLSQGAQECTSMP